MKTKRKMKTTTTKTEMKTQMNRREFMVRVSEVGGGVILTPAVLTFAGLSLPGCSPKGGGSGSGKVFGFFLGFTLADTGIISVHSHEFFISSSEVDDGVTIMRDTESSLSHVHKVTITGTKLRAFGDGTTIMGTTLNTSAGTPHVHNWTLG